MDQPFGVDSTWSTSSAIAPIPRLCAVQVSNCCWIGPSSSTPSWEDQPSPCRVVPSSGRVICTGSVVASAERKTPLLALRRPH
jgi:hypothetical protein